MIKSYHGANEAGSRWAEIFTQRLQRQSASVAFSEGLGLTSHRSAWGVAVSRRGQKGILHCGNGSQSPEFFFSGQRMSRMSDAKYAGNAGKFVTGGGETQKHFLRS